MIKSIRFITIQALLAAIFIFTMPLGTASAEDGTASRCYIIVDGDFGTNQYRCCEYVEQASKIIKTPFGTITIPGTEVRVQCTLITDDPTIVPGDGDTDVDDGSVSSEPTPATVAEICAAINDADDTVIMPQPGQSSSSSEEMNEATDLQILCEAYQNGDLDIVCFLIDIGVIDVSDEKYAELCLY